MKYTTLLSITLAFVAAGCEGSKEQTEVGSDITAIEQGAMAIEELNEICPNSYCVGAFNYQFEELICKKKSCTLKFSAEERDTQKTIEGALRLKGVGGQTIVAKENGLDYVSDAFYDALNGALRDWEDKQA